MRICYHAQRPIIKTPRKSSYMLTPSDWIFNESVLDATAK